MYKAGDKVNYHYGDVGQRPRQPTPAIVKGWTRDGERIVLKHSDGSTTIERVDSVSHRKS